MKAPERLEQRLTLLFAVVSILALIVNLVAFEGITWSGLLNSIQTLSGLLITVIVFFVATRIASRMGYKDFKTVFETYLHEWVKQNEYLIDTQKRKEGKEGKEFYFMLTKDLHPNFLMPEGKPASEINIGSVGRYNKGSFIYCDHKNEEEIVFGLAKTFFCRRGEPLPYGFESILQIAELLKASIKKQFDDQFTYIATETGELQIDLSKDGKRMRLSSKNLANTQENAKALIDVVEYVKTAILAIA